MLELTSSVRLQVLREIDKLDKIGIDGVCAMLGDGMRDASGAFNKGVGLHPLQIGMIRIFFDNSEGGFEALERSMKRLSQISQRIHFMAHLEETVVCAASGETAWDRLLAMPTNDDETWKNGGRPANIAWALDDIIQGLAPYRGGPRG